MTFRKRLRALRNHIPANVSNHLFCMIVKLEQADMISKELEDGILLNQIGSLLSGPVHYRDFLLNLNRQTADLMKGELEQFLERELSRLEIDKHNTQTTENAPNKTEAPETT